MMARINFYDNIRKFKNNKNNAGPQGVMTQQAKEYLESVEIPELDEDLKLLAEKFRDLNYGQPPMPIGAMVDAKLLAAQLQVGKVAPDIVAKDLDGVEFKLSDYRGKVVMLDFWGDW